MALSPVIQNGDLQLSSTGDLLADLDIVTQMPVTLTAYECIYNTDINSQVIPYLANPPGGYSQNVLKNYIVNAHKILTIPKIITALTIALSQPVQNYVKIKIGAIDNQGNENQFSWINTK